MSKPTYEALEEKIKDLEAQLSGMEQQFEQVEKQLRQRQRMDSLGTLAQGVAHDFNNILSGIMAYLNILSLTSDNFTPSQKTYVQNIVDAARRGAATIKQFQKLSARTISAKADIDLYTVAREVFYMLEDTTDRMIEKRLEIEKDRYFIHADINEIHQVFMNLGTNAVHAIEAKGVEKGDFIRLTVTPFEEINEEFPEISGQYYRICFEDTGCGIPAEITDKIFDPLFTTKDEQGQGLGLAMVNDIIVKRHEGRIRVDSTPGRGTVFEIILPQTDKAARDVEETGYVQGGSETILVVDDDNAVRESIKTALEDFGYDVLLAEDGEKGLEVFKARYKEIDAVLLDIIMPKMSGKDLLREMMTIDPEVKVIISSGHLENQYNDKILKNAQNYLNKPFEIDTLEITLRKILDM